MIITSKRIEANRRNAQKSTGPRTAKGKAKSRMNSARHNILARQVIIQGHKITESAGEFRSLWREYFTHFDPVGPVEEMLVNKIVTTLWRLQRVRTAESAEIALNVDGSWWRRNRETHLPQLWIKWRAAGNPSYSMKESAIGNSLLEDLFSGLIQAVERDGELTQQALDQFTAGLGDQSDVLSHRIKRYWDNLLQNLGNLDPAALRQRNKEEMLRFLNKESEKASLGFEKCFDRESKIEEESRAASVLPNAETVDKILRYENALEKQLFNALAQLEHLQNRRLGQNGPAETTSNPENIETAKRSHFENRLTTNEINGNGHSRVTF